MGRTDVAIISGLLLFGATIAISQELTPPEMNIEKRADGTVSVSEEDLSWTLEPEGPREELDLRILGVNANSFRTQNYPLYPKLATHILIVVERALANKTYRQEFCEAKAADYARGMFLITDNSDSFSALQTIKMGNALPSSSRRCAVLTGRPYRLTSFYVKNTDNSSLLNQSSMHSSMPGLDAKRIWVIDSVEKIPCD